MNQLKKVAAAEVVCLAGKSHGSDKNTRIVVAMLSIIQAGGRALLVTGGVGCIASHMCAELLRAGREGVVFGNFVNSNPQVLNRVGQGKGRTLFLVQREISDQSAIEFALRQCQCLVVIYFAGLKAVAESVEKPSLDYDNNAMGAGSHLVLMQNCGASTLVVSSSVIVRGEPQRPPLMDHVIGRQSLWVRQASHLRHAA